MKKSAIIPFAAAALFLSACGKTPEAGPVLPGGEESGIEISNADVPLENLTLGIACIKVSAALAEDLNTLKDASGNIIAEESKAVAPAFQALGATRMRRHFYYGEKFETRLHKAGLDRWFDIEYDEKLTPASACSGISGIPGLEIIEFLPKIEIVGNPEIVTYEEPEAKVAASGNTFYNDPYYPSQWHLYNNGTALSSISGCDLNVVPVWKQITTGSQDVIVSVVDGGVDWSHEDLLENMWVNPDPDAPEYLRYGQNFVSPSKGVTPDDHGTHVAGTIAAVSNNGKGVAGVAGGNRAKGIKGVRIMSCQIFEGKNQAAGDDAIVWGALNGAVISQNSWSYTTATSLPPSCQEAIDYFIDNAGMDDDKNQTGPMKGGIVFFAAGNEARNWGWPAQYSRVVAVSSVAADFRRAYYSNYGAWCDVAAPGGDYKKGCQILATIPDNKYGWMQGTSMACPCASGAAALILSKLKGEGFTAAQLREKIEKGGTDISAFNQNYPLGKLVNAYKSIIGSGGIAPETPTNLKAYASSNTVNFSVTVPRDEDENVAATISIYYSNEAFSSTQGLMFATFSTEDFSPGETLTGSITGFDFETDYWLAAVAQDLGGNRSALSTLAKVHTGENHAPTLRPAGDTHVSVKASGTGSITFYASDPDGHFYNIFLQDDGKPLSADAKPVTVDTTDRSRLIVKISGPDSEDGTYGGTLTITDIYGLSASQPFSYTILPNTPPVVEKQLESHIFTSRTKGSATVRLSEYFSDPDGDALSYTTDVENPEILTTAIDAKGVLTVTAKDFGTTKITVTALDGRKASVSQSFNVLVKDGASELDIYPNPVSTILYIRSAEEDKDASVRITGPTGYVVKDTKCTLSPFDPVEVDMTDCPDGVYSALVTLKGKSIKRTVVKL